METPRQRIAQKYSELVKRDQQDDGTQNFSEAEQAIWLIVSIRAEMGIGDFISVFDRLLARHEVIETSTFLLSIGYTKEADYFDEVLALLDANDFYGADDKPVLLYEEIPSTVWDRIDELGDELEVSNVLWMLDGKLCEMLDEG